MKVTDSILDILYRQNYQMVLRCNQEVFDVHKMQLCVKTYMCQKYGVIEVLWEMLSRQGKYWTS